MIDRLPRRTLIRGFAFFLTLCLVLGTLAWSGYATADRYRTGLENTYQRALDELSDHVTNIELTLNKAYYANTPPQMIGVANKLFSESNQAKNSLGALPVSTEQLETVNRFVAQVGDYSLSLSQKVSKGQTLSDDDRETLYNLGKYAKTVSKEFELIAADYTAGGYAVGKVENAIQNNTMEAGTLPAFGDSFRDMEEGFTDYPILIYDGPFSDHLLTKKSTLTKDLRRISQSDAKKAAVKILGGTEAELAEHMETSGNLPLWNFAKGDITLSITKDGGLPNNLLNSRLVAEEKMDYKEAAKLAKEFLTKHGLKSFKESYYLTREGICTINFAFEQDGVICYPDLVKVGVALDNGEILSFNATGYLMNHKTRNLKINGINAEKARKSVSPALKVRSGKKAVIPTGGENEVLCYEFTCTGRGGETVLVYINAQTGFEEQILILMETEGGVLAM